MGNAGALSLYQRLLPAPFLDLLRQQAKLRQNNRVYSLTVVLWLMICQWLQGHAPLDQAVLELLRGLPTSFWPNPVNACRPVSKGVRDIEVEVKPPGAPPSSPQTVR
jgi:hypothetical protein